MLKKYKYIHLIWANELKFSRPLVDMFASNREILKSDEHAFVTPYRDVYEALKIEGDVYLDESGKNLFNKYAPLCKYIISHDFPSKKIVLGIKHRYKKKIVCRYWGGRRYLMATDTTSFFRNLYASVYNRLYTIAYRYIYDDLALIGIANLVDEIDLSKLIKKTPLMIMQYPSANAYNIVQEAKKKKNDTGVLHVVIGHRSEPLENHIYYLELLRRYPSEKLKIYVPLSYGDSKYRDEVSAYVNKNHLDNVTLMTDFMPISDYIRFLGTVDIAIIECENSLALGNISILLGLNKTIYLSENGVIKKACDMDGIPVRCVERISDMTFEEFSNILEYEENDSTLFIHPYNCCVNRWVKVLDFLK